ncbi:response regulator, partial [Myxococcota bacterium]|nr:response regulator [Myxococcota bacterium]
IVVDDDPDQLQAFRLNFRREFDLELANSGAEALELLQAKPAALLLTDQRMPGMTGVELLSRIQERWPETVCVLMSGWADSISDQSLQEAGIETMISKPWDDAELKQILRSFVSP